MVTISTLTTFDPPMPPPESDEHADTVRRETAMSAVRRRAQGARRECFGIIRVPVLRWGRSLHPVQGHAVSDTRAKGTRDDGRLYLGAQAGDVQAQAVTSPSGNLRTPSGEAIAGPPRDLRSSRPLQL